jgi:glycosyltransferase involved in cell wall biosynthesis
VVETERLRVNWISGAFGFGDDLAYFRQVIGEFARRFPKASISVREGYPTDRYPELPLRPLLRFWRKRRDRVVGDFVYTGNLRIPTPRALVRIARHPTDVVVVVEFTPTALLTIAVSRLRGRRIVQLVESHPRFRGGADGRLARVIKSIAARRCHVQLVSNPATADYVVSSLAVRPEQVRIGAYLTSVPSDARPGSDDGGPVRFLFLNSLQERKGMHLLLDALGAVSSDARREWTLDVVGDGPARDALKRQINELGVASRVTFHGAVSHDAVGAHYCAAHVVVCPTQGDYRSLAGFEAVNALRPVVLSTRDGAAEEIVTSGAAAVAVDPLDVGAFSAALRRYLEDDDYLGAQLARAAHAPALFSLETVGSNLETAVRAAAGMA